MPSNAVTFVVRNPTNGSPWLVDHCVLRGISGRSTPSQQMPPSGCLSSLCWQLCPLVRHTYLCPLSAACNESSHIEESVDTWYMVHVQNSHATHRVANVVSPNTYCLLSTVQANANWRTLCAERNHLAKAWT